MYFIFLYKCILFIPLYYSAQASCLALQSPDRSKMAANAAPTLYYVYGCACFKT